MTVTTIFFIAIISTQQFHSLCKEKKSFYNDPFQTDCKSLRDNGNHSFSVLLRYLLRAAKKTIFKFTFISRDNNQTDIFLASRCGGRKRSVGGWSKLIKSFSNLERSVLANVLPISLQTQLSRGFRFLQVETTKNSLADYLIQTNNFTSKILSDREKMLQTKRLESEIKYICIFYIKIKATEISVWDSKDIQV